MLLYPACIKNITLLYHEQKMKAIKTIMLAVAFSTAASASAQFTNTTSSTANKGICDYNRIALSYNNTHFGFNEYLGSDNNFNLNGFGVNYIHGFSVSKSLPMFIETGVNFNFEFGSTTTAKEHVLDEWMRTKETKQFINMQVPVNFTYRFTITDGVYVAPYAGLNFKLNIIGRYKDKIETSFPDSELKDYGVDPEDLEGEWMSVFSKRDMGSNDYTWKRFQVGWHIGAGLTYESFYLGLQYGTDFIPIYKYKDDKINTGNLKVSLGYTF